MKKRMIAVLLSALMIVSALPVSVLADEAVMVTDTEDVYLEDVVSESEEEGLAEEPAMEDPATEEPAAEEPTAEEPVEEEPVQEPESEDEAEEKSFLRKAFDFVGELFENEEESEQAEEAEEQSPARKLMSTVKNFFTTANEDSHSHAGWTAWTDGTQLPTEAGNYYLDVDVTLPKSYVAWEVPTTGTTNLCLNGHVIRRSDDYKAYRMIKVFTGATLNLYDCGTTVHKFTVDGSTGLYTLNETSGTEIFIGGCITGSLLDDANGGAIQVNGGTLNLYGGNVVGNRTTNGGGGAVWVESGVFNVYGGTVMGNYAKTGGGILSADSFTLYDGKIENNRCSVNGGGVFVSGGTAEIKGGSVSKNSGNWGGGIEFAGGTLKITGGKIIKNTSANYGGGINVDQPNEGLILAGGTISQNIGKSTSGAAGVSLKKDSTVVIGGDITILENTTNGKPSNLGCTSSGGTLTIGNGTNGAPAPSNMAVGIWGSTPTISGGSISLFSTDSSSFSGGNGTQQHPFLLSNNDDLCQLARNVKDGTTYEGKYFKVTKNISYTGNSDNTNANSIGDGEKSKPFKGTFDGDYHTITINFTNADTSHNYIGGLFAYTQNAEIKNVITAGNTSSGKWYIGGVVGSASNTIFRNCINNVNVSGATCKGGICGNGTSVTIINCINNGTISGGTNLGGIIGSINGGSIENCYNTGSMTYAGRNGSIDAIGGIVGFVSSANSVSVKNCYSLGAKTKSSSYGATGTGFVGNAIGAVGTGNDGIYTEDATKLTLTNVYYRTSDAPNKGMGTGKTAAEFKDGTVADLLNANVTDENGYELWDSDGTTKYKKDVTYTHVSNFAALQAAVYSATDGCKKTIVLDANIEDMTDQLNIPTKKVIAIDLNGHNIDRKQAGRDIAIGRSSDGSLVEGAKLTIQDSTAHYDGDNYISGKITGGKTESQGGGIYNYWSTFILKSGAICGNETTTGHSGAIFNQGGSMTMSGGEIRDNIATTNGGAIVCAKSSFVLTLSGGKIYGNTAGTDGGAIYINEGASLVMAGGEIKGNSCGGKGGAVCVGPTQKDNKYPSAIITGGEISGNTATGEGGGVYVESVASLTLGGTAKITGNKYNAAANNVYLLSGNITIGTEGNAPAEGMEVGVTTQTAPVSGTAVQITAGNSTNDTLNYFTSDNSTYYLGVKDSKLYLSVKPTITVAKHKQSSTEVANPVYGTAKSAYQLFDVAQSNFVPAATLQVEWKHVDGQNVTWDTTSPETTLSLTNDGKVTTTAETPAGDYAFRITNGKPEKIDDPTSQEEIKPKIDNPEFFSSGEITLTVEKAAITPTVSITGWTYGSTANDPSVTAGNPGNGTVTYSYKVKDAEDSTYDETVPTNTGSYTVKAEVAATDNYAAGTAAADFTIAKATPSYSTPTNLTATYGQTLADVTLPDGFAWQDAGTTSVGAVGSNTFKVTFTPTDTDNYNTVTDIEVAITVSTNGLTKPTATSTDFVYTGSAQTYIPVGFDSTTMDISGNVQTDAGTYTVTVTPKTNYAWSDGDSCTIEWIIAKANASVTTAPTANTLSYNGQAQTLVTAGVVTGGTIQYKLGADGSYADDIATATDAGNYTVYYKVVGDSNHNDVAEASVAVTISPKDVTGATVGTFAAMTYSGSAQTPSASVTIGGLTATGAWSDVTNVTDTTTFTANGNFTGTITGQTTGMAKSTPATPTDLTGVAPTSYGGSDGKITGTTAAMEYSTSTDFTPATACSATETTGLSAGTYYVRVKATANTNASAYATVEVPAAGKANFNITVTDYSAAYDGNAHSITLNGVPAGATVKYGAVSGTYDQDSITYTDFTNGAKTVYVKVTMDGYNDFTGIGTVTITKASQTAPNAGVGYTIDYANEKITPASGHEVSTGTGDGFDAKKIASATTIDFGATYSVRKAADDNHNASPETTYTPQRPTTPGTPVLESVTGTTVVVTAVSGQEYSKDGGTTWVSDGGNGDGDNTTGTITFTGLTANTPYSIITRVKATASAFKSENCAIALTGNTATDISKLVTVGDVADQQFTGEEIKPDVTVKLNGQPLASGTDYTVAYSDNVALGNAAKATITFCGSYSGSIEKTFHITAFADAVNAAMARVGAVADNKPSVNDGMITSIKTNFGLSDAAVAAFKNADAARVAKLMAEMKTEIDSVTDLSKVPGLANMGAMTSEQIKTALDSVRNEITAKIGEIVTVTIAEINSSNVTTVAKDSGKLPTGQDENTKIPTEGLPVTVEGLRSVLMKYATATDFDSYSTLLTSNPPQNQAEVQAIENEIAKTFDSNTRIIEVYDFSIELFKNGASQNLIYDANGLLTVNIDYDTDGKEDFQIYRYHNYGTEENPNYQVDMLSTTANANDEYIKITDNGIEMHVRYFCTYALTYEKENTPTPEVDDILHDIVITLIAVALLKTAVQRTTTMIYLPTAIKTMAAMTVIKRTLWIMTRVLF